MTVEANEKVFSKKSAFSDWFRLFLGVITSVVILFWAVFGLWSYFTVEPVSYTIKPKQTSDNLIMSGKDGAYFVSLPLQQIQLVESISPLRTLEVQIAFAVQFTTDKNQIQDKLPQIQDTLISYLRTTSLNELQETSRLFYIKEALLERMNNLLFPTQIQDVLFQKIVVKEDI